MLPHLMGIMNNAAREGYIHIHRLGILTASVAEYRIDWKETR